MGNKIIVDGHLQAGIWNWRTAAFIDHIPTMGTTPFILKVSENEVVTRFYDDHLRIVNINNVNNMQLARSMYGHRSMVNCALVVEGKIISGSSDNTIIIWNNQGNVESKITLPYDNGGVTVLTPLSENRIIVGSGNAYVSIYNLKTNQIEYNLRTNMTGSGNLGLIYSIVLLDEGNIVCKSLGKRMFMVDLNTNNIWIMDEGINSLLALPNNSLVTGSSDGIVKIWE